MASENFLAERFAAVLGFSGCLITLQIISPHFELCFSSSDCFAHLSVGKFLLWKHQLYL